MLHPLSSALPRLSIEAGQIIIPPDGDLSAHLTPLVPGVSDLAPPGAVIVVAVVIEIIIVIIATFLAITPKIAPLDPFVLTVGPLTISLGIARRKERIIPLRHLHLTSRVHILAETITM